MPAEKKVAILFGPQFHDQETTVPRDYLVSKGVVVDILGLDLSELTGKYNTVTMTPDKSIADTDPLDYDGLIIPGGGAPERIRVDEKALTFVRNFWDTGRPVGAICHGPQVLISAGVLTGVTTTCYVGIRDDALNAGANYVDQEVCVDGQLITSRKPEDLPAFNETFTNALFSGFLDDAEKELDPLSALEYAIAREKGAQEFYAGVAETVADESIRNKFRYLSVVELEHYEQLSDLFKKLSDGRTPRLDLDVSEIGKRKVSSDIDAEEAIQLAMSAEQKAYDFYYHAALKARGDEVSEMFEYLAAEELEHKRYLSVDMASSHGGQGHFQWATHFSMPPGMDDLW